MANLLVKKQVYLGQNGDLFQKVEYEIMYLKAKLFGDKEIIKNVIRALNPVEAKTLGHQISAFEEKVW